MPIILSSDRLAHTEYYEDSQLLVLTFRGIMDFELASNHFEAIMEFVKVNEIVGIIADLKGLRGSFNRFMDYFKNTAYPILIERGFKAEAIIISDDLIIQNLAEKLKKLLKQLGIECEMFDTMKKAKEWMGLILKKKDHEY